MQKGKRMIRGLVAAVALAASACAAQVGNPPPPTAGTVEAIRYETSQCFGVCPVYVLTVRSDGSGTFEGIRHTAVTGTRNFTVTRQQYSAFRSRIEPFLPAQGERRIAEPNCTSIATDLPSVDITVTQKGPQRHLYIYYGCDMDRNEAMFEALRKAPEALPQVQAMIGTP
jgi:hypothetical protein